MGVVFWLFSWASAYLSLLVFALALSSGMYIVAELCEEYPTISGKIIKITLIVVLVIHLVLWIDGIPWKESLTGIASHCCYGLMLRNFPFVQ